MDRKQLVYEIRSDVKYVELSNYKFDHLNSVDVNSFVQEISSISRVSRKYDKLICNLAAVNLRPHKYIQLEDTFSLSNNSTQMVCNIIYYISRPLNKPMNLFVFEFLVNKLIIDTEVSRFSHSLLHSNCRYVTSTEYQFTNVFI